MSLVGIFYLFTFLFEQYYEICVSGVSVSLTVFGVRLPLPVVCGTEPVNVCACLPWVG